VARLKRSCNIIVDEGNGAAQYIQYIVLLYQGVTGIIYIKHKDGQLDIARSPANPRSEDRWVPDDNFSPQNEAVSDCEYNSLPASRRNEA
jgi:hypothetical protein